MLDMFRLILDRRRLLQGAIAALALAVPLPLMAQDDPLPSWNDGPAKQTILAFVHDTTTEGSAVYVAPEDRIATFDQDGTTWVEHPLYGQALFALDRLAQMAPDHPEWKDTEPFKAVLSGDHEAMAKFSEKDWMDVVAVTHAGMSTADFEAIVADWLPKSKNPVFGVSATDLVYQPMIEVMELLRAHAYRTYIVTGGGQEFVRVYSTDVYGIPPEQVIGSSIVTRYEMQDGKPVLMRDPKLFFNDNDDGKAIGINLFIGKRPQIAFGKAMNLHLAEISTQITPGAHAVLILDGAGWHRPGGKLDMPANISLLRLPSCSPELNPVENIWQYLRQNHLANRVFDTYTTIVDACCEAWKALVARPATITSIATRDWAKAVNA